jgi:acetyl esterase/lipase
MTHTFPSLFFTLLLCAGLLVACADDLNEVGDPPGTMSASPAAEDKTPLWANVPETISPEWGEFFEKNGEIRGRGVPASEDTAGWLALQEAVRARQKPVAEGLAKAFDLTIRERVLGGIPIVEISPANPANDDKIGVYVHGGAYIQGSARNPQAVLFSAATGLRVISIEYTLAPHSKWQDTTAQVLAVFSALAEEGYSPSHTALGGDSAGGGLAAGSLLRMRDEGMEMPAALVLWSPWADISETGDTYLTLRDAEVSFTYNNVLGPAALVYADPDDHGHPYVSPVYGDFNKEFPPTLIQGGTREIFLSNFIRLYQALDQAGKNVKLDLYEGMPHVFMAQLPDTAEAKTALAKTGAWVSEHLLDD